MARYTLSEVKTKQEVKKFLELPVSLYKGYDNWIRPLDAEIEAVFDPKTNKLFADGEATRWILQDEKGVVVGRIAAFYNMSQSNQESQPTGGCGFFESVNSQEVANILFDKAKEYLLSKGMQAMDGPVNFGTRDQFWGLLVTGFNAPIYGMNFNHIYYKELFENYGFRNYFNQHSYLKNLVGDGLAPQVRARYERLISTGDYEFRHVKKSDYATLPKNFVDIYNGAWSNFTGVNKMDYKEGQELFAKIRPIMDDRLIQLAFYKGKQIGFFIMIPDINGAIRHLGGKFGLWSKLKILYHVKIRKSCKVIIGLIFAVDPEFQGKGIESGMIENFRLTIGATKHHYSHMELVWIGDFNPLMMRMVEKYVCATPYKMHTTYRYMFDPNATFERAPKVSISRKKEAELTA